MYSRAYLISFFRLCSILFLTYSVLLFLHPPIFMKWYHISKPHLQLLSITFTLALFLYFIHIILNFITTNIYYLFFLLYSFIDQYMFHFLFHLFFILFHLIFSNPPKVFYFLLNDFLIIIHIFYLILLNSLSNPW